jgi:dTDP-4-dehydrorhamnose reductase
LSDSDASRPEIWGGLECSIVRVGDIWRNQFEETRHLHSPDDLERIASLGIRTLRYPVHWETTSPERPDRWHWGFADQRLGDLRRLAIRPVIGLLHHGSGPRYTSMTDQHFPLLLSRFAAAVARRYPWADLYTPVNEPLTTARFSGLYGHWYPHGRDMACFLRCLVNQCLGTLLAMREIRKVNPAAKLVQTEDLGKVFSTPRLRAQSEHENERRWLSFDLLSGRVDRHHPWHATLLQNGITEAELRMLASGEATPDILGINYYATSERFLDHDMHRYPACFHGGNGRQCYADVEALRIDLPQHETGPRARLTEAWERYRLPLAVTEVHHGSTREEQLRWLAEVWHDACALRQEGVDLRAVTAWSLLGAVDWNSLLTERRGHYESGAFDIRGPRVRLTAVGRALREMGASGTLTHPVLDQRGWWRREGRHYHPPGRQAAAILRRPRAILITGAGGRLGQAFVDACALRGLEINCPTRNDLDIGNALEVEAALDRCRPWAVINAATSRDVDDPLSLQDSIVHGSENLARACARRELPLVTFSPDFVFDGGLGRPYVESDGTTPRSLLGRMKAEAEQRVAAVHPRALMIRMSRLFGRDDDPRMVLPACARRTRDGFSITATYLPDVTRVALDLLIDEESGVWHLANHGALALREMEELLSLTIHQSLSAAPLVVLGSERGVPMPGLADAVHRQLEMLAAFRKEPVCPIAAE